MSVSFSQTNIRANHAKKPLSFWGKLGAMIAVRRQLRHLAELDDHMLNDIGVTRAEALKESMKTAWNAPDHWQR